MAPADNEIHKEIFDKISKNDVVAVKSLLSQCDLKDEIHDEHGMTPLQNAAYKGNKELVQLLLDQGADVNSGKHEFGYTALHFAALSGNTEVCHMLLCAGAKSYVTNSVGRTPSQMAAFVGNHASVAVINNFVPKSDVDYYTVPSGFETEPKLSNHLAAPLHNFVIQVNLHPVKVAVNLQRSMLLYEHLEKIQKILELMSEREIKKGFETNEIMSFKFHYLSCVLQEIARCRKQQELQQESKKTESANEQKESKKSADGIELFIKKMLKTSKEDSLEYQETFLRDSVRDFPYRECTIFRQMVTSLSRTDSPSALSVITAAINGQRAFSDSDVFICSTCGEDKATKKCSKCKSVQYCDKECQRLHWFIHKKYCSKVTPSNKEKPETIDVHDALVSELSQLKAN